MSRVSTILLFSAISVICLASGASFETAAKSQQPDLDYHDFLHCIYFDGTQWQKYSSSPKYYPYQPMTVPQAVVTDPNSKIESDYWYDFYNYENAPYYEKVHNLTRPDFNAEHGFEPDYHNPTWNFWLHFWQAHFKALRPACRQEDLDYFNSNKIVPGDMTVG
ncbi:uncharacterized protein LOC101849333 [Aplysia californica]|uniref:Uncharacterized protein LOC101849333 n=1 Tax=Aplysia californica TaxID=6500 RepID=A0ABM0K8P4_APLCA|nr:uncharacterized protein LOC101849333 [Aplysia californica]